MEKTNEITQEQTISTPKSEKQKFYISFNRDKHKFRSSSASQGYRNIWSISASSMVHSPLILDKRHQSCA